MTTKETLEILEEILHNDPNGLIEDIQTYIKNTKANNQQTIILISIFSDVINKTSLDNLLLLIKKHVYNDTYVKLFTDILNENLSFFISFNKKQEYQKFSTNKLIDISWKLVGRATLDQAEQGLFEPKIILKLIFSNNTEQVIESDFTNFKKLQEEIDFICSSFNSGYAKKVLAFAK